MKFGLFVPPFFGLADPHLIAELAAEAEGSGWDGFFLWDHMLAGEGTPIADPWVSMAAMAGMTRTIHMGTMVTPLSRRRPWVMARQIATLDRLCDGRLVVGIGLGDDGWQEFSSFGEETDPIRRGVALDESLTVLRGLLTGKPVSFSGTTHRVGSTALLPPAPVPFWAAGRWPRRRPLARAARLEGFFPIFRQPDRDRAPAQADLLAIQAELGARHVPPGYDLAVTWSFPRGGDPTPLRDDLRRVEEAGVTWALHGLPPRPLPVDLVRTVVTAGPPRD